MDPAERLERLDRAVEVLAEAHNGAVILVEGARDALALRELGVTTRVLIYNQGRSMSAVAEAIRGLDHVFVLFDWDRKGGQLTRLLRQHLGTTHHLDFDVRKEFATVSLVRCVEDLPAAREGLVRRVHGSKADER